LPHDQGQSTGAHDNEPEELALSVDEDDSALDIALAVGVSTQSPRQKSNSWVKPLSPDFKQVLKLPNELTR
jgi:hypothetical protein